MREALRGATAKVELSHDDIEWAHNATDGEQLCTQHHCESGSKKRFYIKRSGPSVVFYCHNCGVSGAFLTARDSLRRIGKPSSSPVWASEGMFNTQLERITWGNVTDAAELWLAQHYVCPDPRIHGSTEDPSSRLWMAGFTEEGDITALQGRRMGCSSEMKYITYIPQESHRGGWVYPHPETGSMRNNWGIICEDLTSALRCHLVGVPAIALMGTKPISRPPKGWDSALLWLDGDRAGLDGTMKFVRECSPLFKKGIETLCSSREPKEMSPSELEDFIGRIHGH